jgi:hypothetical protein
VSTLADVYAIDMERRNADAETWRAVLRRAVQRLGGVDYPVRVVEVGASPRVLRLVNGSVPLAGWTWIDVDAGMLRRCVDLVATDPSLTVPWAAVHGDAADPGTWAALSQQQPPADVVIFPYSALYLLRHERQEDALRCAGGSVRSRGLVAAEVFVPRDHFARSGQIIQSRPVVTPPGEDGPWRRSSTFRVDAACRVTRVLREYGPTTGRARLSVEETIHWRLPAELAALAYRAGLDDVEIVRPSTDAEPGLHVVPDHALLVARS